MTLPRFAWRDDLDAEPSLLFQKLPAADFGVEPVRDASRRATAEITPAHLGDFAKSPRTQRRQD